MKHLLRRFCLLLLLAGCMASSASAQHRKKSYHGFTEAQLVARIEACVSNEDAYCYLSLFPDFDTLSKIVLSKTKPESKDHQEMLAFQNDASRMMRADSTFNAVLKERFELMINEGKAQGLHWSDIVPVRFELIKGVKTRNEIFEHIFPERFTGYVFVMDRLTRKTFGFTVAEMFHIDDEWYGGYLGNVFEASTVDEYEDARAASLRERKNPSPVDTAAVAGAEKEEDEEEAENRLQKLIAERKYYTGMFDNEIPVQLYVRSLKGGCKEVICSWEAIYKFGDQDDYILLKVSKGADDKWTFTEDPPTGSMELTLKNGVFTGTWTSTDGQTGYEVKLSEIPPSPKKRDNLEAAFLALRQAAR